MRKFDVFIKCYEMRWFMCLPSAMRWYSLVHLSGVIKRDNLTFLSSVIYCDNMMRLSSVTKWDNLMSLSSVM